MSCHRRFGWELRAKPLADDVYLYADGTRVVPVVQDLRLTFRVPRSNHNIWIISGSSKPSDVHGSRDERTLGLCIQQMIIDPSSGPARRIAFDNPHLGAGFYGPELAWRWTDGRAELPRALWTGIATDFDLHVHLKELPLPRWVDSSLQKAA